MDPLHFAAAAVGITAVARAAAKHCAKIIRFLEYQKSRSSEESCINSEERFYLVEESFEDAEFDIVIIHDIQNSRPSRPEHATTDQTVRWLRDNVSEAGNARILTYHYDTTLRTSEYLTRRTLLNEATQLNRRLIHARANVIHGERPIIFIAHSLGGILLKNALIFSEMSGKQEERDILLSTAGCLFFDTPHHISPNELCESIWASVLPKLSPLQSQGSTWQRPEFFSWARDLVSQTGWFDNIIGLMPMEPQYIKLGNVDGKEINSRKDGVIVERLLMVLDDLRRIKCRLKVTLAINLAAVLESQTRDMICEPYRNTIHTPKEIWVLPKRPEPRSVRSVEPVRLKQLFSSHVLKNSKKIQSVRGFDLVQGCLQSDSIGPYMDNFEFQVSKQIFVGSRHSGKSHCLLSLLKTEEEGTILTKMGTQYVKRTWDAEFLSSLEWLIRIFLYATGHRIKRLCQKGGLRTKIKPTNMDDKPIFLESEENRNLSSIHLPNASLMQNLTSNMGNPTDKIVPSYVIAGKERSETFSHSDHTYSWDAGTSGYLEDLASVVASRLCSPCDAETSLLDACFVDANKRNLVTLCAISLADELGLTIRYSGTEMGCKGWQ